jgi:hypothetical protein
MGEGMLSAWCTEKDLIGIGVAAESDELFLDPIRIREVLARLLGRIHKGVISSNETIIF